MLGLLEVVGVVRLVCWVNFDVAKPMTVFAWGRMDSLKNRSAVGLVNTRCSRTQRRVGYLGAFARRCICLEATESASCTPRDDFQ